MKSMDKVNLAISDEFLEEYNVEGIMTSPVSAQLAVLIASKQENEIKVVSNFQFNLDEKTEEFFINDQLCSFGFLLESKANEIPPNKVYN
jgi:hypothetical protein